MRILLFLLLMSFSAPAFASACYSNVEAEAEQGIRIHSELMVIGLNCQHMGTREGMNLFGEYKAFTHRHAGLFSTYENILMKFYKKNGVPKPEVELNSLRTNFANKISKDVASMRPDVFCARYFPRMERVSTMQRHDVRQWAATIYDSHPVSYPLCEG